MERAAGDGSPALCSSSARRRKNSSRSSDRFKLRSPNFSCSARRVVARCSAASISSTSCARQFVDGQSRRHGGNEFAPKPVHGVAITGGEKSFADQRQTVKPAQRLDHDIGRDDIFLEIVEQRVTGFEKFLAVADVEREIVPDRCGGFRGPSFCSSGLLETDRFHDGCRALGGGWRRRKNRRNRRSRSRRWLPGCAARAPSARRCKTPPGPEAGLRLIVWSIRCRQTLGGSPARRELIESTELEPRASPAVVLGSPLRKL